MNERARLQLLGTRARQAVETLVRSVPLESTDLAGIDNQLLYAAAVRIMMRLVVILFAESRRLLPVFSDVYSESYSVFGLHAALSDLQNRDKGLLSGRSFAWARVLALFRLVYSGSSHPAMPVRAYGGELFEPGLPEAREPAARAVTLFERPGRGPDDHAVARILDLLCRHPGRRNGRTAGQGIVDFSSLSTEYIGTLYESLLDYRLKRGPADEPVLFLNMPSRPALPASRLKEVVGRRDRGVTEVDVKMVPSGTDATGARPKPEAHPGTAELVAEVVPPGQWYLVRGGGTRKSSGIFYTPARLARATVRKTLEPLCYRPDNIPMMPEEILRLRVCDPAMGSGAFLVAALNFLTAALLEALHHYGRLKPVAKEGTAVELCTGTEFVLPHSPGDPRFDSLLAAHVKRHVVENTLYGVDLDPLTVELARISLWLETMDHRLPFTFLDHKLKTGNSLTGAWFKDLEVYPVQAWKREGGDVQHKGGVHFGQGEWSRDIRAGELGAVSQLTGLVAEARSPLLPLPGLVRRLRSVRTELARLMTEIHELPVQLPDKKRERYTRDYVGSKRMRKAKSALDRWCALWFWPHEELERAPLPVEYYGQDSGSDGVVEQIARRHRFFHWELAFPDVFVGRNPGFDAIVGNPPWDVRKPSSVEYFVNEDPLFGTYTGEEAEQARRCLFRRNPDIEAGWLEYCGRFKALSNWFVNCSRPAGRFDRQLRTATRRRQARGKSASSGRSGFIRPFSHQGSADINSYKLFVEQAWFLCRTGGRLGLLLPSGIYGDRGARDLRKLLLDECRWEWLFGFENRRKLFPIDGRFKFAAVVAEKGGRTDAVRAGFMHRSAADWEVAEETTFSYPTRLLRKLSPAGLAFLEVTSGRQLEILKQLYASADRQAETGNTAGGLFDSWNARYVREFDAGNRQGLFSPADRWENAGYRFDGIGYWCNRSSGDLQIALPVYQGAMLNQFDFAAGAWSSGPKGKAGWRPNSPEERRIGPRYLMDSQDYGASPRVVRGCKIAVRRITNATNTRTCIAALVPDMPCTDKAAVLAMDDPKRALGLLCLLNSFCVDYAARSICSGTNLDKHHLCRLPFPAPDAGGLMDYLPLLALRLNCGHPLFAPLWLEMAGRHKELLLRPWKSWWASTPGERLRLRAVADACVAELYRLSAGDFACILDDCGHPAAKLADHTFTGRIAPRGFWRVDKTSDPELRHTVLAMEAFVCLKEMGPEDFMRSDWQLPEHVEMGGKTYPVRERLGPQMYDWQTGTECGWDECRQYAERLKEFGIVLDRAVPKEQARLL